MSKAQEDPPTDLRVEPIDQRSAEVDWKPPENTEEKPIGYELYYVPANKEIEIDEFDSLPKWNKVSIDDGEATSHVLKNALEPNTEYVFKIRAIYPKGPGVFSEPCITKTLPEGKQYYLSYFYYLSLLFLITDYIIIPSRFPSNNYRIFWW